MGHNKGFVIAAVVWVLGGAPAAEATKVMLPPADGTAWVIESADYTGDVQDQVIKLEARYTIRTIRDGWMEIPLAIPGATITGIEIEKKTGEAHIMARGATYVLAATKKGTFKIRIKCSSMLAQDSQYEGMSLGIPRATFSTLTLTVPRKEVELRQADALYVEREAAAGRDGTKLTARLGPADRIELRWRTRPATPVKVDPVMYGEVHTFVTVEEQLARVISVMTYRMAQGETKELTVRLSSGINVLNVRGTGIDDWRVAESSGDKTLTVTLNFMLKDADYQLIVEGEEPIQEAETSYALPEITLVGVKQERGYVAVARTGSLEVSAGAVEGANRVDVRELPEAFSSLSGSAAMLAFKYHQHPYQIAIAMTRHQDHAVLSAVAEVGQLETVLSRQGEMLTRATYLIRANKKQFLEVSLPAKASLWSCIVNGRSVKPVQGADTQLLVPLDALAHSTQAISVEIVYFERQPVLEWTGRLALQGPVLDVPTTISNWSVYAPADVKLFRVQGNMEQGAAPVVFLGDPIEVADASRSLRQEAGFAEAKAKMLAALEKTSEGLAALNPVSAYFQRGIQGGMKSNADSMGQSFAAREGWQSRSDSQTVVTNDAFQGLGGELGFPAAEEPAAPGKSETDFESLRKRFADHAAQTGILPLKIRLPSAGRAYRFNRMMTATDALRVEASFVHVRLPGGWLGALGLILFPAGGFALTRFRLG